MEPPSTAIALIRRMSRVARAVQRNTVDQRSDEARPEHG
jgi:hypothetical protein